MLRLDTTLRKLELVLGGAITTTQPNFLASWSDASSSSYTGGSTPGNANGVTAVTLVAAPGAGLVRDVDYISVNNLDTVASTVTIRLNDNGTLYTVITVVLQAGDQLRYTHALGWQVCDNTGTIKSGPNSGLLVAKTSATGSAILPVGTTGQRDASPAAGYTRFNSTLGKEEYWNGTAWIMGGGATGGGSDDVFYENSITATTDYTITTNKNAMSAGPITINNGVTITVPNGSVWSIV